jgi:pentapeptide MXKDX repeat protein
MIYKKESIEKVSIEKESIEKVSIEKEAVKKETVKKEAVKKEAVKKEAVKKEAVKKEAVKKEAVKKETIKKYIGGKKASEILGVHQRTLYIWEKKGLIDTIRTPGNKRLYNVDKFLKEKQKDNIDNDEKSEIVEEENNKLNLCYVRVSSLGQKEDLERQKTMVREKYPDHIMIEDIGSGMNFNKRGIRKIIKLSIEGKINELVVAYKDRLTRVGYELIEDLIKEYSGGKIIIINKKENLKPEEELVYDVLQIMNIFVAKLNGLRKYNKNKSIKKTK